MRKRFFILLAFGVCLALAGCNAAKPPASPAPETAAESSAPRIYVTNEVSGDLSVIDSGTRKVIATVPLGKRPRGIHASPDQKTLYVALSGSPITGPDVDESRLPPPDKSADGIGVFNVAQNKVVRVLPGGSDPENFDVSKDGKQLFISNEDTSGVSVVDIASGTVLKTIKIGGQPEGVGSPRMESGCLLRPKRMAPSPCSISRRATLSPPSRLGIVRARSHSCLTVLVPTSTPKMTGRSFWWTP